jgi:hypothetical protein
MVKRRSSRIWEVREEEPMSDLTSSVWRTAYVAAILESDAAKMAVRISDARTAINERLEQVEVTPHEHEALEAARQKLPTLKVQHVDVIEPAEPTGDTVPSWVDGPRMQEVVGLERKEGTDENGRAIHRGVWCAIREASDVDWPTRDGYVQSRSRQLEW